MEGVVDVNCYEERFCLKVSVDLRCGYYSYRILPPPPFPCGLRHQLSYTRNLKIVNGNDVSCRQMDVWLDECMSNWMDGWLVGWLGMTNISLNIYMSATVRLWSSCSCFSYCRSNQHPWWRKHCQTRFATKKRWFCRLFFCLKDNWTISPTTVGSSVGAGGCTTDSWSCVTVDSPLMIHCCCRWVQEIDMKGHGCWFLFSRVETRTHTNILVIQLKSFYFYTCTPPTTSLILYVTISKKETLRQSN